MRNRLTIKMNNITYNQNYCSFRLTYPNSSNNLTLLMIIKIFLPGKSEATNLNAAVDTLFAVPGLVLMSYSEKKPIVCGSKLYLARYYFIIFSLHFSKFSCVLA